MGAVHSRGWGMTPGRDCGRMNGRTPGAGSQHPGRPRAPAANLGPAAGGSSLPVAAG